MHLKDNANILITGGAGFIGSHMAELLLKKGMSVIVFDNLSTGLKDNVKLLERYKRCTFIKADITDGNALAAAIAECDAVFHFAAVVSVPYSVENPDTCFSVNVSGFENIIAALRGTTNRYSMPARPPCTGTGATKKNAVKKNHLCRCRHTRQVKQ